MAGTPVVVLALLGTVSVLIAAISSMGEAAISSARRQGLGDDASGVRALQLLDESAVARRALSFVRVFAEVTASACITLGVAMWVGVWWLRLVVALVMSLGIAVIAVRVSPRSVANRHPQAVLRALSPVLLWFVAGTRWAATSPHVTHDDHHELATMVERVRESQAMEDDERELISSVFELGQTLTREVMVPRTDMLTMTRETSLRDAQDLFLTSGYSRIPVLGKSSDDVVGVCYFKDVVRVLAVTPEAGDRPVSGMARAATFVPESKPADDLLREIQQSPSHLAMVVDEYGGIAGLVTIEDVLEEIVGELTDEYDRPVLEAEQLGVGHYRVPARMDLDDFSDLLGVTVHDDDVDTVGGLLAKILGKVPLVGSKAEVDGIELIAERTEGRRKQLATILVTLSDRHHPIADSDRDQRMSGE